MGSSHRQTSLLSCVGSLLLIAIALPLQASQYRLVSATPDPEKKLSRNEDAGGEHFISSADKGSFTLTDIWHDGPTEISRYAFKMKFEGLEDAVKTGDVLHLKITVNVTATGDMKKRPGLLGGRFQIPGTVVAEATAGMIRDGEPLVPSAEGSFDYKIKDDMGDFDIYAIASGWGTVTAYHYQQLKPGETLPAPEPTTPAEPPATTAPAEPPAEATGTIAPWVQLWLGTSRYQPGEKLVCRYTVFTGKPEATPNSLGKLTLWITRDSTAAETLWLFAGARAGKQYVPPPSSASADELDQWSTDVNTEMLTESIDLLQAPRGAGEYRVEAKFVAKDGRTATTSLPFDVMATVKRLVVLRPDDVYASTGGAGQVEVTFEVDGIPAGQGPPKVKAWGTVEFGAPADLRAGKGFQPEGDLPEREVVLTDRGGTTASDKIKWTVNCRKTGLYRLSFTVVAPYYGTREGEAYIIVTAPGELGGKPAGQAATPAPAAPATAATTTGGTAAGSKPVAGTLPVPSAGLTLKLQNGQLMVSVLEPNSFAEVMGVKVGWVLTAVDEQDVAGLPLAAVTALMHPVGKPSVGLHFRNPGGNGGMVLTVDTRK